MEEVSKTYTEKINGFADIVVEITSNGLVRISGWPSYFTDSTVLIGHLRIIADNIEKIKTDAPS